MPRIYPGRPRCPRATVGPALGRALRDSDVLRGWREEFQRDVVWITEGQPRTVSGIDDTAVDDAEFV